MNVRKIFLSTADAARLLNVSPAALTKAARGPSGGFRGIKGRKGEDGSWVFPAAAVRALARPHPSETPNGTDQFVELVGAVVPEVRAEAAELIGSYLLGSEYTPGWSPEPGRLDPSRLKTELALVGLMLQAAMDRVDLAETLAGGPVVDDAVAWLLRVTRSALKYRDGADGSTEGVPT